MAGGLRRADLDRERGRGVLNRSARWCVILQNNRETGGGTVHPFGHVGEGQGEVAVGIGGVVATGTAVGRRSTTSNSSTVAFELVIPVRLGMARTCTRLARNVVGRQLPEWE